MIEYSIYPFKLGNQIIFIKAGELSFDGFIQLFKILSFNH